MKLFVGTVTRTVTTGITVTSKCAKKESRRVRADPTMVVVDES